jgi:hypothetical protein
MPDPVRYRVMYTARIAAPASRAYNVIADYRDGHPRILPPQFRNMVVEQGGRGAGTLTRFEAHAFGQTRVLRHEVFEPEPGRVLLERDRDQDLQTTFTVEPIGQNESQVTIATDMTSRPGLAGHIERWFTRRFLLGLYRQELQNLERVAGTV